MGEIKSKPAKAACSNCPHGPFPPQQLPDKASLLTDQLVHFPVPVDAKCSLKCLFLNDPVKPRTGIFKRKDKILGQT